MKFIKHQLDAQQPSERDIETVFYNNGVSMVNTPNEREYSLEDFKAAIKELLNR